ncbi:MAG: DUF5694 domain-containing protein [Gemmatimonadales bacterium]
MNRHPAVRLLAPLFALLAAGGGFPALVHAQTTAGAAPPIQVMVLGVFHFANPNADYAQFQGVDVLTPARQKEIDAVVSQLARFKPTKIALEREPAESDSINTDYRRYRAGTFPLTRNEIHQLGFRLAGQLGLSHLYPVDFSLGMRIDSVMAYAGAHDTGFAGRFQRTVAGVVQLLDRMQREETIGANLRFLNDSATILLAHQPYADMATVGAGDGYIGARVVAQWYERNLHIFANLAAIAQPGDRILLIIGQGHTPILRELVRSHAGMQLVEALPYLR